MPNVIVTALFGLTLMVNAAVIVTASHLCSYANMGDGPYDNVGDGNCSPELPQWTRTHRDILVGECESMCNQYPLCIGYNFDDNNGYVWFGTQTCRLRFQYNADISSPPTGWTSISVEDGSDGKTISGADGKGWPNTQCYKKQLETFEMCDYHDLGKGKCLKNGKEPNSIWYETNPKACKALCDQDAECGGLSFSPCNDAIMYGCGFQCLIWVEDGLSGGGARGAKESLWRDTHCWVKNKGMRRLTTNTTEVHV